MEKLFPEALHEPKTEKSEEKKEEVPPSNDQSIAQELEQELQQLKAKSTKNKKLFQSYQTGCKGKKIQHTSND